MLVRQRPGTAKGVIFLTLEDETGVTNVVVWATIYERFRRAVISGRLLRVTGRLQREAGVVHVVAEVIEVASTPEGLRLTGAWIAADVKPSGRSMRWLRAAVPVWPGTSSAASGTARRPFWRSLNRNRGRC